ncbi:MAG TPA: DUF1573 domain-containing protein [Geothrix sp.]|nr:DUF1573 domain-containing protein [Geothrix sp.]
MLLRKALVLLVPAILAAQAPVIHFDKLNMDLGRITPDRKVAAKYHVTNTGNAFLSITQVRPSCGCTYTMLGKWSLAPGESTDIEATFDPKGQKGSVRKSIEVVSNDPANPNTRLTLEAEVVQEIMPSVESVYFPQSPKSTVSHSTIRYVSGNGEQVQIVDVKAPGAPFLSFTHHTEGKDVVMEVAFDGRKVPAGRFRGVEQATVRFTNSRMNQLPLNIQWELKPSILVKPAEVLFQGAPGAAQRQSLTLKQADGKAFRVTGSNCSLKGVLVEGLDQKAGTLNLTVVLPASLKAGRYSETIVLTTDDPDQPELTIRLVALLK